MSENPLSEIATAWKAWQVCLLLWESLPVRGKSGVRQKRSVRQQVYPCFPFIGLSMSVALLQHVRPLGSRRLLLHGLRDVV